MVLFYSLGLILLFASIVYFYVWKDNSKDRANLEGQWNEFIKAVDANDLKKIKMSGNKLIFNKYLGNQKLNFLIEVINTKSAEFPELKELGLYAFNKKLHYDRIFPSSGSSGGIKQSW